MTPIFEACVLGKIGGHPIRLWRGEEGARLAGQSGDVVVVIDALRASTTILAALEAGMRSVRPVVTFEECRGEWTAGEQDGVRSPCCKFDNSPVMMASVGAVGAELILKTSNGTKCLMAAAEGGAVVLVGALRNVSACGDVAAARAQATSTGLSLVAAGCRLDDGPEDEWVARLIARHTQGEDLRAMAEEDVRVFIESPAGVRLIAMGKDEDVRYCAQRDLSRLVPFFDGKVCVPVMKLGKEIV